MRMSDFDNELIKDIARFYNRPLDYVRYAFEWGVGELDGQDGPDVWQTEYLLEVQRQLEGGAQTLQFAVSSGHGVGKSAMVAWLILWAISTRPNLGGVVTANTMGQLKDKTWAELALWHRRAINRHWFKWTATKFFQAERPDTWFVSATPWSKEKTEAFAGLHADEVLIIMDEASAIPEAVWETASGAMTTGRAMMFCFGNPTRNTGQFRECFGKMKHRWTTFTVDSRKAKMVNQELIQQWVDDYGDDSDYVRVRVRGVFPRMGNCQLISSEWVTEAMKRTVPPDAYAHAPLVFGVDVARFGDDQCALAKRKGLAVVEPLRTWRNLDTMTFAGLVAREIEWDKPAAVFIDVGGMGAGVVDRLHQLGFMNIIPVNFGSSALDQRLYFNKRTEMWCLMRDWLQTPCCLPGDPELEADLIGPEYGFTGDGSQLALEKKKDMKARGLSSPDKGDALALTFAQPVMLNTLAGQAQRAIQKSSLWD